MNDDKLQGRKPGFSRRDFNALVAGGLMSQTFPADAQAPDPARNDTSSKASGAGSVQRIDVHHHFLPPEYVAAMGEAYLADPAPNRELPKWKVADSLDAMDRQGVTSAVVSITGPGVLKKDPAETKRLARLCNDYGAKMVVDHPTRFGNFSCLPLPDVDASLEEIRHVFDTLKADGIGMMTNYADLYLGDAKFIPVMDELNRRKAVVYVHPTTCNCNAGLLPDLPHSLIEFPHDSTRTVCSLMFSGTFSRCPDIRWIFSHAGGTLPFLAPRIAVIGSLDRELAKRVPEGVMPTLKKLYYDTASSANPITFGALFKFVTPKNVVLGTDFPFIPEPGMKATLNGISAAGLSEGDVRAIESENAAVLLPRIAAAGARVAR